MEAAILLFLFASFLLLLGCFVFVGWYLVMRRYVSRILKTFLGTAKRVQSLRTQLS